VSLASLGGKEGVPHSLMEGEEGSELASCIDTNWGLVDPGLHPALFWFFFQTLCQLKVLYSSDSPLIFICRLVNTPFFTVRNKFTTF
jgi:hypothetical protein